MTVPPEYVHASRDFDRFMADMREISMLATHHAAERGGNFVYRGHAPAIFGTAGAFEQRLEILPVFLRDFCGFEDGFRGRFRGRHHIGSGSRKPIIVFAESWTIAIQPVFSTKNFSRMTVPP